MENNQAIGIFDSGLGGLTVIRELLKALPNENIVYFGDTARVPYGNKSKKTISRFSIENADFLIKHKVKIIVVACNTSCSLSLNLLKKKYKVPVVGVIEPAVRKAVERSRGLRVGVIGTRGTIKSNVYNQALKRINKRIKIFSKSCPLFVPLIEEDWINDDITLNIGRRYLSELKKREIDTLILACTHYPLLMKAIRKIMGREVELINSAEEVAGHVKELLELSGGLRGAKQKGRCLFYVSDEPAQFVKVGGKFLGRKISCVRKV
ncbi:MAG: glutamate racemase [Candidatus Omnitrophica bacterium]|nr:glutamate racemase [Candidatus Omnitrophota bacterium]